MSEDYPISIFDAVALGRTCFQNADLTKKQTRVEASRPEAALQ